MAEKPPYRVPTMVEVAQLAPNGFRVASTFAGGGGSSTGYRMAGFTVMYANEFVPAALETYQANMRPGTITDESDIRQITGEALLDTLGLAPGELDVLDGSPPCASFSTAGKRHAKWGTVSKYSDTEQRTDDLFFEFIRLLKTVQPKVFVAENVSGLVKGTAKGYFKLILKAMREAGYTVQAKLLNAQWLGVPQMRQRLIFVGVHNDLGIAPAHPKPLPYIYTMQDVFPYVAKYGTWPPTAQWVASGRDIAQTMVSADTGPVGTIVTSASGGGTGWLVEHDTSGNRSLGDISDRPCPTITCGVGALSSYHFQVAEPTHAETSAVWDEDGIAYDPETGVVISMKGAASGIRKFTLAELRAVCGFPPDYVLTGTYNQRWERLGRSVPPLMMKAVAEVVRDEILGQCAG